MQNCFNHILIAINVCDRLVEQEYTVLRRKVGGNSCRITQKHVFLCYPAKSTTTFLSGSEKDKKAFKHVRMYNFQPAHHIRQYGRHSEQFWRILPCPSSLRLPICSLPILQVSKPGQGILLSSWECFRGCRH